MNIDQSQFYDFIKENLNLIKTLTQKKQFLDKQKTGIPSAYGINSWYREKI